MIPLHKFHIPVMGLAYTTDTPIKVARWGISSVISIVENRLIEMMRKFYYPTMGELYQPISTHEHDFGVKRITDYLNLVNRIFQNQVVKLRNAAFETGSEIVKYFVSFYQNLLDGTDYYYKLPCRSRNSHDQFINELSNAALEPELQYFQYPFINP